MSRILVGLSVLLSLMYVFYSDNSPFASNAIGYGEARYAFHFPHREVEMVAIGERYLSTDCERDSIIQDVYRICEDSHLCSEIKYDCKTEMSSQYQNMLKQQVSSTHYIHMLQETNKMKGVILFWGLTDKESQSICNAVVSQFAQRGHEEITMRCI